MFRLLEITFENDKESQAIYSYDDVVSLQGSYESKLGQAMLNGTGIILIGLDEDGKIAHGADNASLNTKYGEHTFSPRLYEAKTAPNKDTGVIEEVVDLAKYDDENTAHARFHTKKGAAINNNDVSKEVLYGFDGEGKELDYCKWERPSAPVEG